MGIFSRKKEVTEEVRTELPIQGSPYVPVNATNLVGLPDAGISPDRAVALTGVYRCVSVISTAVSQLDLGVYRTGVEIAQPSTSLVVRPNVGITRAAFLEQTVVSLATTGNAYWLLLKDSPTGDVKNITVMNPMAVRIEYRAGKKFYVEGQDSYPAWRVAHLKHTRLAGYDTGVGPIQVSQNELRGAIDLRNFAENWFREGKKTTVVLKTQQALTSDVAKAYSEAFDQAKTENGTVTLGNGLEPENWTISPSDAKWLEAQAFSLAQIARMFGVPGILLDLPSGDSMTYSNREDVMADFIKFTLMKYLNEVEGALTDLLPRGQEVRFKVDTLNRASQSTRYAAYATAINAGFLTIDEVREIEGLPALGGDTAPVNNITGDTESGV